MTLYLVRHAKTVVDPAVPPRGWALDPDGLADLDRLRDVLPRAEAAWYASDESKALSTARHLTDAPVAVVPEFREVARPRFEPGYEALVQRLVANPAVAPAPGWESADAATTRFSAALREIIDSTRTDVVVVTHGLVMSLWLAELAGEPMHLDHWRALEFPDVRVLPTAEATGWGLGRPGPFRLSR